MIEPVVSADRPITGDDVLRWYVARAAHVGAAAEVMARDLAAAWAEVEEVRGQLDAARRLVVKNVSRGYVRAALPLAQ